LVNSSDFLVLASKTFGLKVRESDVKAVQSVVREQAKENLTVGYRLNPVEVESAVRDFFTDTGEVELDPNDEFNFVVRVDGQFVGTDVKYLPRIWHYQIFPIVEQMISKRQRLIRSIPNATCQLVLVTDSIGKVRQIQTGLSRTVEKLGRLTLRVILLIARSDGERVVVEEA